MKSQLVLIVLSPLLMAATPLERQMSSAPMAHAALGGSATLKVHYVRTELRRTAEETAVQLKLLRHQADICSKLNARSGKPVFSQQRYRRRVSSTSPTPAVRSSARTSAPG